MQNETDWTREGWPLLTVEKELNMRTRRVQKKEAFLWLVRGTCRARTRDFCSALTALVGPVQYIFFLSVHYLQIFFVPIAQQAGQAAMLGRLSLSK